MAEPLELVWTPENTARELIDTFPDLLGFFDSIGLDDCCQQLPLKTIAKHHGIALDELIRRLESALAGQGAKFATG